MKSCLAFIICLCLNYLSSLWDVILPYDGGCKSCHCFLVFPCLSKFNPKEWRLKGLVVVINRKEEYNTRSCVADFQFVRSSKGSQKRGQNEVRLGWSCLDMNESSF